MPYKEIPIPDVARKIKRKGSIVTGSKDAIFLRNEYQELLEEAYQSIAQHMDFLGGCNRKAEGALHAAQAIKQNVTAHQQERADLYKKLYNDLTQETDIEKWMWDKTQKGMAQRPVTIKQKIHDTDIDEMHFGAVLDFLKQYPKLSSDPRFANQQQKIFDKEREIRQQKEKYNAEVSRYNHELSYFPKNLQIAEDKFTYYNNLLHEGQEKLINTRYRRSVFYKLATEEKRHEVNLQTKHHTTSLLKNILNNFKQKYSRDAEKPLTEMQYE